MSNMSFKYGTIRLDSAIAVYYSGQVISGSVVFELNQPVNFSALCIDLHGEGNVSWTEKETEEYNGVKRYNEVKYIGKEIYCQISQCLAGGAGHSQLKTGPQVLPFRLQIPTTVPSSFQGERGEVSYHITAYLDFSDPMMEREELRKKITVVSPFDLNLGSDSIKQPINLEFEEVYGCNCIRSPDPITIRIQLPVSGYCPGQTIPVSVEVQNESSVEVRKIHFQLISRERYRSQQPIAEYVPPEKVLATLTKGAVMGNTKKNFTCSLVVPDMLPPYLENCSIIDVGYFFKTKIKLSGCNNDLEDESEICLGLVPLVGFTSGEYVHPMAGNLPLGPVPDLTTASQTVSVNSAEPSNTPYSVNDFKPVHNAPYPGQPAPYPGSNGTSPYNSHSSLNNSPYPSQENVRKPFNDYAIGFKVPDGTIPPYSSDNKMPYGSVPPYPTDNFMPQVAPGPLRPGRSDKDLRIHLPPSYPPAAPSAPPPST